MEFGPKSEQSVREQVLELARETSRIHNKPCLVSDLHMVMGNCLTRSETRAYLENLVESNRDMKKIEGGYFYEGKEFIREFTF